MKCTSCGNHYFFAKSCPLCGDERYVAQNPIARFLLRPLNMGSVVLNCFYLYVLLTVNLSLICMLINAITYRIAPGQSVWCHYIAGGFLICYFLLKISFSPQKHILSYVRRALYTFWIICAVTQMLLRKEQNFIIPEYIFPASLILSDLFCLICGLLKWCSRFSLILTLLVNTAAALILMILMHRAPVGSASLILTDLSFIISMISAANVVLLKALSLLYRLREERRKT